MILIVAYTEDAANCPCDFDDSFNEMTQEPTRLEDEDITEVTCEMAQDPLYRDRPEHCFDKDDDVSIYSTNDCKQYIKQMFFLNVIILFIFIYNFL